MAMNQISFDAFRTTAHHFGMFFPGKTTTISLAMAIHRMFDNDPMAQIYDGEAWLHPIGILFKRDCDRHAFMDLLAPYGFTHTIDDQGMMVMEWKYPWDREQKEA